MSKGLRCLLCRAVRDTRDGMRDHLADHTPKALAEELLRAAYPIHATAVKTAPVFEWVLSRLAAVAESLGGAV